MAEALFFTYGIVNPWDRDQALPGSHAIMQFGDFKSRFLVNKLFPVSQFTAARDRVSVAISGNTATDRRLTGRLTSDDGRRISWDLDWNQSGASMPWAGRCARRARESTGTRRKPRRERAVGSESMTA